MGNSFCSSAHRLAPSSFRLWAFEAARRVDRSEAHRAVPDDPDAILLFGQADRLSSQVLADIQSMALPLDLTAMAYPAHRPAVGIVRRTQPAPVCPFGGPVVTGWRGLPQRLVRPLLVVGLAERVEPPALRAQARGRRRRRLLLEGLMETLQPTVLLRLAGIDALRHYPRLDQLNRKRRQTADPDRRERRPVVRTDHLRQTKLPERRRHHRPGMAAVGPRQRLAAQQIAAVRIGQGQRFATRPVARPEPAFQIDAPHRVGIPTIRKRRRARRRSVTAAARHRKTLAPQQVADAALRRPPRFRFRLRQIGPDLLRTPARVARTHRQKPIHHQRTHRLRMVQRRTAPVRKTHRPRLPVTLPPLVGNPAAYPVTTAKLRNRQRSIIPFQHHLQSFVHHTALIPGHDHLLGHAVHLLPMSPVYSVTYVAGSDHPSLPPQGGKGYRFDG